MGRKEPLQKIPYILTGVPPGRRLRKRPPAFPRTWGRRGDADCLRPRVDVDGLVKRNGEIIAHFLPVSPVHGHLHDGAASDAGRPRIGKGLPFPFALPAVIAGHVAAAPAVPDAYGTTLVFEGHTDVTPFLIRAGCRVDPRQGRQEVLNIRRHGTRPLQG